MSVCRCLSTGSERPGRLAQADATAVYTVQVCTPALLTGLLHTEGSFRQKEQNGGFRHKRSESEQNCPFWL